MVRRVSGTANGVRILFERAEGNRWEARVPPNLSGEYAVDLYAEDMAGNVSYCCKMLFAISGHKMRIQILDRGYEADASIGGFLDGLAEGGFTIEYTICG